MSCGTFTDSSFKLGLSVKLKLQLERFTICYENQEIVDSIDLDKANYFTIT